VHNVGEKYTMISYLFDVDIRHILAYLNMHHRCYNCSRCYGAVLQCLCS